MGNADKATLQQIVVRTAKAGSAVYTDGRGAYMGLLCVCDKSRRMAALRTRHATVCPNVAKCGRQQSVRIAQFQLTMGHYARNKGFELLYRGLERIAGRVSTWHPKS